MKNIATCTLIFLITIFLLCSGCKDDINPPVEPPPPPIEFDTSLTRFYSDINSMGVYVGKSSPEPELVQMSNNSYQETLKRDSVIACALAYHARYIRLNLFKDLWDDVSINGGRDFFLNYYRAVKEAGLLPVLNINYHKSDFSTPEAFPSPVDYNAYLKEVLDSLNVIQWKPAIIVVENEEANFLQYAVDTSDDTRMYADLQRYVDQLAGAISTGANYTWWDGSKGVEVTNGGFMTRNITFVVWNWLKNEIKDEGLAVLFGKNAFSPLTNKQINKIPQPTFIDKRSKINKYLEGKFNQLPMKYINIHWTEPIAARGWVDATEGGKPWDYGVSQDSVGKSVLNITVLYYHTVMPNKLIMSNEMSQLTYSPKLMQQLINMMKEHPFRAYDIVTFYDADGSNEYLTKALHNTIPTTGGFQFTYTLRDNGIVLSDNLKGLK